MAAHTKFPEAVLNGHDQKARGPALPPARPASSLPEITAWIEHAVAERSEAMNSVSYKELITVLQVDFETVGLT
jgi:hypothetical protein